MPHTPTGLSILGTYSFIRLPRVARDTSGMGMCVCPRVCVCLGVLSV